MYKHYSTIVYGFHTCEKKTAIDLVNNHKKLQRSKNKYDWLGEGVYFWENSVHRASRFGSELKTRGLVTNPVVVGAVINLGFCLDLLDSESLSLLKSSYQTLSFVSKKAGIPLPENKSPSITSSGDLLLRNLDCATINYLPSLRVETGEQAYDSVRGVFWEGDYLYPNAGFKEKNHIQLCIRNPNCIKGYFWPIDEDKNYPSI